MSSILNSLIGEKLTHVDLFGDEILLTTESGRKIQIYHEQDCCESVGIENVEGDFKNLIGKVIIDTSEEIDPDDEFFINYHNQKEWEDSYTDTKLTFKVDGATVITRWIGNSNGYYSERVDYAELKNGKFSRPWD